MSRSAPCPSWTHASLRCGQGHRQISGAGQRRGARPLRRLFRRRLLAAAGGPALRPGAWRACCCGCGISSRIRDWAEERTHSRTCQVMLYVAVYVPLVAVLHLAPDASMKAFSANMPMACPTRAFWQWLGDFGIGFALTFAAAVLSAAAALCRHPPRARRLVAMGRGPGHRLRGSGGGDLAGLHRAAVQSLFAPARQPAESADPVAGARQ